MKIAVDAMGGDYAPEVVVQGALQAASEWGVDITLVGQREAVEHAMENSARTPHIRVHHCTQQILMGEPPLKAIRQKKDSSIKVAFDLVKRGEADAVVSAGNSGALLAAGVLTLGRIKSVERPAFVGVLPGIQGDVILIDVGANVDCRPNHLFHFGVMAHAFALSCLGMKEPKIGLLSIGEEGRKGNEQVRLAHDLFAASDLHFVGNVEGRDILSGKVQIIVCDGFVGNVVLKLTEGLAEAMFKMLKEGMKDSLQIDSVPPSGAGILQWLGEKLDYAEQGGAPILGIKGVAIVCHGASPAKAIKNAIRTAALYVEKNIPERLARHMERFQTRPVQRALAG
jgi:glycerol-3-phosphate acyltransferase PlsX